MKKSAIIVFILLLLPFLQTFSQDQKGKESGNVALKDAAFVMISGKVTHNGVGLSGVVVYLTGASTGSFTTDGSGDYSFPVIAGNNYTVTPAKTGYNFNPGSKSYTPIAVDEIQNFVTVIPSNTISGNITLGGSPFDSVIVMFSGSSTGADTTNVGGNYSLTVNTGGNYTVTPMRAGYIFTPPSQIFNNITSNQILNFIGTAGTYTASGRISILGSGLDSVLISYTGTDTGTVYTDTSGTYSFPITIGSNYTITPSKTGYNFNPVSRVVTSVNGNIVQDFDALANLPDAPVLSAPLNNSINLATSINLLWNASSGATSYNLQVSTSAGFGTLVQNITNLFSTTYGLTGLSQGTTYYWRVSANNISGTSAWSTAWNFTTQQSITSAPQLQTPINDAPAISTTPTLAWNPVAGATSYSLQVSQNANFSSFAVVLGGITTTSYTVTAALNNNTKYYWRVNASNGQTVSAWSDTWNFTTVPVAPGVPSLLSPANSTINLPLSLELAWNQVSGATTYNLQVSNSSAFTTVLYNLTNLTGTTYTVSGLSNNTTYFWRVSASNGAGAGSYSGIWSFATIAAIPPAPILVSPAYGATDISINPLITWGSVNGITGYDLQVSPYSDFATYDINEQNTVATSYQLHALYANRNYYWRVRSRNAAGVSPWAVSMFVTRPALSGPILIQPENNSRLSSLDVFFGWAQIPNISYYEFALSKYADFRTNIANPKTLTSPSMQIFGLDYSTTYYWRVRTLKGTEIGEWSQMYAFTTRSSIQGPTLTFPGSNSYGFGSSLTFRWEGISGIQGYDLQVARDITFYDVVSNFVGISENYQKVSNLSPNSTYYWRVRGWKVTDIGEWSQPQTFKTASSLLSQPVITYPPNDRVNVSINTIFRWSVVPGATGYEVLLANDSTMTSIVASFVGLGTPSVSVNDLSFNKTYYWKVLARQNALAGEWTPVYKFTTHDVGVGVKSLDGVADSYNLMQNYPNPFNPSTNINYSISEASMVTLKIFDLYGREIETLVNENHPTGVYNTTWEPKNLPSGVYYYQLRAGKFNQVKKMVYLR